MYFWTFRFSDFPIFGMSVFQILKIGEILEKIWKNKGGVKIPLSEAKFSFDTPKGVINARKKSSSTKTNAFSTFPDFRTFEFLDFKIFEILSLFEKVTNHFLRNSNKRPGINAL